MKKKALSYDVRKARTKLKNDYFTSKANQLNYASEQRDTEEEFRLMKRYTSLSRVKRPMIPTKKLEGHFSEHFGARSYNPQPELEQPDDYPHLLPPDGLPVINDSPPDCSEIKANIAKLKNGRCQGTDNIHSEQLKYTTSESLFKYITLLLRKIWSCLMVPKKWLEASITCLYKRGLRSLPENYRGLSITATLSKVISGVVINRIRATYEKILLPTQYGFRANRSTSDAIFILRRILELSKKSKAPVFVAFIDLKAAYDWIPRDALFRCLDIRLRCPKLTAILRALYTGTKACIKGGKDFFETVVGCRQGALESPPLFNIYMDFVVRAARKEEQTTIPETGFHIEYKIPNEVSPRELRSKAPAHGNSNITELLYADDQGIFANSVDELQQILTIYDKTFKRFGLQMSYDKTETMVFNADVALMEKESIVSVGDKKIKNVRKFKYLGYTITNSDNTSSFLHARMSSAFEKWNELKHILMDKRIQLDTRIRFLTMCVRSRLLYSIQAWHLLEGELKKVEVIWHGFLRKMVIGGFQRKNAPSHSRRSAETDSQNHDETSLDWSFKLSNERLRQITKTRPIRDFCFTQQVKYMGHVCRMDNSALQKQVLFDRRASKTVWNKTERTLGIDAQQIRRTMMNKSKLQ